MQGLKETGIFESVISSALSNQSDDDKFSSSIEDEQRSTSENASREVSSRNFGQMEPQDRGRNVLEIARSSPKAIPPQSPPPPQLASARF